MVAAANYNPEAKLVALNLRRLVAAAGMGLEEFCESSGVDPRTLRGILRMQSKPHTQTVKKLADGLGVSVDELYRDDSRKSIDLSNSPVIATIVKTHPSLFAQWTDEDFEELASNVGVGGAMTEEGAIKIAEQMNVDRELVRKLRIVLQTHERDLIETMLNKMYQRATQGTKPAA